MRRRHLVQLIAILTISAAPHKLLAQNAPPPTPDDQMGLSSYQSYHGGDIDHVNLATGGLSIRFPLLSYPQRGNVLKVDFSLHYNSKQATVRKFCSDTCDFLWMVGSSPWSGGISNLGAYVADDQSFFLGTQQVRWPYRPPILVYTCYYSILTPDGSSHPLVQTSGATTNSTACQPGQFRAFDGTDWNMVTDTSGLPPYSDSAGIRYNTSAWKIDPNGNQITTTSTGIMDTMGRQIPKVPNTSSPASDASSCSQGGTLLPVTFATVWNVPGYNGGTLQVKFCYVTVAVNIPGCVDVNCSGGLTRNFQMIQSIVLLKGSNNLAWTFEYQDRNAGDALSVNYGSLTKITLPTGGTISYTYSTISNPSTHDLSSRWVASRTVNANDGTGNRMWTYAGGKVTDPLGNDEVHSFAGPCGPLYESSTQSYQGPQSSANLVKTVATQYRCINDPGFGNYVNIFPTNITTTLANGQVSQITKGYDSGFSYIGNSASGNALYGKEITSSQYDYGPNAPGPPLRTTNTSYVWQGYSKYLTNNLLNLPSSIVVTNGTNKCAETDYSYDDSSRLFTPNPPVATQHVGAPGSVRGNLSSVKRQVSSKPCQSGATWSPITSYTNMYDTGMPYQSIDPLGNATTYTYDPALVGALVTQTQLPDTSSPTLAHHITKEGYDFNTGLRTSHSDENSKPTAYGYDTMWRISSIGYPDGGSTTFTYNDSPGSLSVEIQHTMDSTKHTDAFVLLDNFGREISHSKANGEATPWDKTDTCYDARGLKSFVSYPYQASSYNGAQVCSGSGDSYAYDALKRVLSVTHSDNSFVSTSYVGAATSVIDEGNGNGSQSIQKISQVDGLGRLVSLCELSGSLPVGPANQACGQAIAANGYLTTYQYDGLSNLTGVTQGGIGRGFTYDSLSRLLTAFNPESGTVCYGTWTSGYGSTCTSGYDADGNPTKHTMLAANQTGTTTVTTTYQYDNLNRLLSKTYSDGTTPGAYYYYDQSTANGATLTNPTGRLTSEGTWNGSRWLTTGEFGYDPKGRVVLDGQNVPTQYTLNYTYDYAGDQLTNTNGLGVTLTYGYNVAQRVTSLASTLSDANHPPTMLSSPTYNAFGSLLNVSFGNAVQETNAYYTRGWLQSINTVGPDPGHNIAAQGNVTFKGPEQSVLIPNTYATGSVQIGGYDQFTVQPDGCNTNCTKIYDSGTVTITVNGTNYTVNYRLVAGQPPTKLTIASDLTNALNGGSLVNASYDSTGKITLTAKQMGTCCNYSLSYNITVNTNFWTSSKFTVVPSGSSLTGGTSTPLYDTGNVSVTVGSTQETVGYGQGDTPSSIAINLANKFNNDATSLVTASPSGATLNLTSKATGSGSNYALSTSSTTSQSQYFSQPSFIGSPNGMSGGLDGKITIYTLGMGYAPNGNVVTANDSVNGNWVYTYDAINRLVSSNRNSNQQSYTYDIDRYGNRWHQTPGGQYSFTGNNNRIDPSSGISYDAAGNVTNDGIGHTFTYDAENRIISVNGGSTTYVYDAEGPAGAEDRGIELPL
jgi:hypothetical protein